MRPRGGFDRRHRISVTGGILCFVLLLVVCQIWLLSATMNAFLGGDTSVVWPACAASSFCLALVGGLLVIARGLARG